MTTTSLKSALLGALVVASLVTPFALQHQAQAKLRDQNEALRQQAGGLAKLQEENAQLSNLLAGTKNPPTVPNEQFNEVLRLRGESGRLQAAVQEFGGLKTNGPLSRKEALASMRQLNLDRVNRLKQLFADNPAQAVPELPYLTDSKWMEIVQYDHHAIDPDGSRAMSSARATAQNQFAMSVLSPALREYGKNNNGQFPTDLSQLAPYFKSPVDDSVLRDWVILPGSSLPDALRSGENWVITQKAPVNAESDQRMVIGLKSGRLGTGGPSQWGMAPSQP
jgi:hypothetical protein